MQHTIFIDKVRTADYQMTRGLREIIERDGNVEDLVAFMQDRHLPVDEIEATSIAEQVLREKPEQGYLTISERPTVAASVWTGYTTGWHGVWHPKDLNNGGETKENKVHCGSLVTSRRPRTLPCPQRKRFRVLACVPARFWSPLVGRVRS